MHLILEAIVLILSLVVVGGDSDQKHAQALKDFVPDHPHLHELVDKTHEGDVEAKHRFEREALSIKFNATKGKLPKEMDEEHIVLHFLDDYASQVSESKNEHRFMELEPFINMLGKHDDLREKLVKLGGELERAECDFTCLGDHLTEFLNEAMQRMMKHVEL